MKTDEDLAAFNRLNDSYFKSAMASSERKHITVAFLNALMSHAYPEGFPEYEDFKPVVFAGLLNFGLHGESGSPEWYSLHKVLNMSTHKCDCDLLDMHFAELSLLRRKWRRVKHKPSTKFEELMFYFGKVGGKSMGDTLVQEIADRNPVVAELLDYEKAYRSDPLLMRQYVFAERAHYDYLANLEYEREEGLAQGRKEGREEGFLKGHKEGLEKGLEEGLLKGLAKGREEGLLKGFVKGRDEGLTEGREEERRAIVRTIRAGGTMTDEQIAEMLKLPLHFVKNS